MRSIRRLTTAAVATAVPLAAAACGTGGIAPGAYGDSGSITYWLWDANQLPMYQKCADDFEKQNPDISIKIEQYGWDDYWGKLLTGFIANSAPDVFTNHSSQYGQFASRGLIEPLDEFVERDDVDLEQYVDGLTDLWVGEDAKRYGLPKDWDTVAIFYNEQMAEEAGLTHEDLSNLTWNPKDGGTFEDAIARLTVDRQGVRGDEPGFDKNKVATFGLGLENSGNGYGQTQWSMYTGSTGWTYMDQETWGTEFNYDDPRFQETIGWWRSLINKGYMPTLEATVGGSLDQQMQAGRYAMVTNGSWTVNTYTALQGIDVNTAPTPIGPNGERASMFNGLADSITTASTKKEAAWQWVKFLGSEECQRTVAEAGVVFPAIESLVPVAERAFGEKDIDVSAFTTHVENDTTVLYPIADRAVEIDAIMATAMDNVMSFDAEPSSLTAANRRVNALFEKR